MNETTKYSSQWESSSYAEVSYIKKLQQNSDFPAFIFAND